MLAVHQAELSYVGGYGMQAAFVMRANDFGGGMKPREPEPGRHYFDAADIYPEGGLTMSGSLIALAEQIRQS